MSFRGLRHLPLMPKPRSRRRPGVVVQAGLTGASAATSSTQGTGSALGFGCPQSAGQLEGPRAQLPTGWRRPGGPTCSGGGSSRHALCWLEGFFQCQSSDLCCLHQLARAWCEQISQESPPLAVRLEGQGTPSGTQQQGGGGDGRVMGISSGSA